MTTGKTTVAEPESSSEVISVRGARVHNLKNIDVDLVRNQFTVITGPSGSGKSTLAFDTLYAEGQRQYVESLSVYARQFLHQIQRPDVDLIQGLPPTICINQRSGQINRRSTVSTVTEIHDYLRLLMARQGTPFCYKCGSEIKQQNPEQIQSSIMDFPENTKVMLLAPMVRGRKGAHKDVFAKIRKAGFVRARVDGSVFDLENLPELAPRKKHHIDAVVDRVIIREGVRSRIGESIRLGLHHGAGLIVACYLKPLGQVEKSDSQPWKNVLFSTQYACADCGINYEELETRTFSFNSPYGACPVCDGLGALEKFDPDLLVTDRSLSLKEGAVQAWKKQAAASQKKTIASLEPFFRQHAVDWTTPVVQFNDEQFQQLMYGDEKDFPGLLILLEKEYATTSSKKTQEQMESFRGLVSCRACSGSRLRPEARHVRFHGKAIHEISAMHVDESISLLESIDYTPDEEPVASPLVDEITKRLRFLQKVGVGYLSLDRPADSLSGGELQRVRLATSIGSGLIGVCYILDEPSIGLHPRDNQRLINSLQELQRLGNTVLIVEHDEAMMRAADQLIDVGPGAGRQGGEIVAQGSPEMITEDESSMTGCYLSRSKQIEIPSKRRRVAKSRSITIEGASANNLKDISVRFPLGALVCVSGVSGSGKSSLVNETLAPALQRRLGGYGPKAGIHRGLRGANQIDKVIQIDQSPIGRTARSNPATFGGIFDEVRRVFAGTRESKQRGFGIGRFSFNVKGGRCEACQGQGEQRIEMNFLPDLFVSCDECHGARFNRQTLRVKYRGRSIADVLQMCVDEAVEFFENFTNVARLLKTYQDVGLGYLPLGQPSTTLSGGEAQRIKLATELARVETGKTLYLLDEPTTGLHFVDIQRLLNVLNQLVDKGNSIIVIEHNLDIIKAADWIIDLGPEGGQAGGELVAEGVPEDIAKVNASYTGQALKSKLR